MTAGVPPDHEEECIALQEELQDERREHLDLVQRQRELLEKIHSQQRETEELKRNITMLEAKVAVLESSGYAFCSPYTNKSTCTQIGTCEQTVYITTAQNIHSGEPLGHSDFSHCEAVR